MKNFIKGYFAGVLVLKKIQNVYFDETHAPVLYTQKSVVAHNLNFDMLI
ncbi:hypothetical protein [Legionella santicrucis]|nr:hypothetical protein [Legionella santicrucis]